MRYEVSLRFNASANRNLHGLSPVEAVLVPANGDSPGFQFPIMGHGGSEAEAIASLKEKIVQLVLGIELAIPTYQGKQIPETKMTNQEVIQELVWCGLGYYDNPKGPAPTTTQTLEAYGDGKLNVVNVEVDGKMVLLDGDLKILWQGYPQDGDQISELMDTFGHYAPS